MARRVELVIAVLVVGCRESPPPRNVRESRETPPVLAPLPAEDAGVEPVQGAVAKLEQVSPEAFAPDRLTPSLFELIVETKGVVLAAGAPLRRGLPDAPYALFAGTFPDAAWAAIPMPDPNVSSAATSVLYRWRTERWVEVEKAVHSVAYALGAWTEGRMLVFRDELRGGVQAPKPYKVDSAGVVSALPIAPKDFLSFEIEPAKSGELFVRGRSLSGGGPGKFRPLVARFDSTGARVYVDALPTGVDRQMDTTELCVKSASSAVVVGEARLVDEDQAITRPAIWRFDGRAWKLEEPALEGWLWGIACSKDGSVWVGIGSGLWRFGSVSESYVLDINPSSLVATDAGDVFVLSDAEVFRLQR